MSRLSEFSDAELEEYLRFLDSEHTYIHGLIETLNAVRTPETRGRSRVRSQPPSPPLFRSGFVQDEILDSDEESDSWMDDSDSDDDMDDIATVRYWSYPDLVPVDSDYESDDDDTETVIHPWEDPTVTP